MSQSLSEQSIQHGVADQPEDFVSFLVRQDVLDETGATRIRRAAEESGGRPAHILVSLGLMNDEQCCRTLADFTGCSLLSGADLEQRDPELLTGGPLPVKFLRENLVLPLRDQEDGFALALTDPTDKFLIHAIDLAVGKPLALLIATRAQLERSLADHDTAETSAPDSTTEGVEQEDLGRLRELASEAPVIRLVSRLLDRAVELKATDIHLESSERDLTVRFRLDGQLKVIEKIDRGPRAAVLSRIKLLAHMNIAENRLPQDGRIRTTIRGRNIDLRVATLPAIHGETIVIRILDQQAVELDFAALGFSDRDSAALMEILHRPNGIFLVTGPTSSGKTTTLYAALKSINQPERKIITVEDPVEYELPGIVQTQVKPEIGLSFARVLRATLRHNPNVLLIGEIRDLETASIAVEAALTGHLVLATLHTNSAAASISRLLDMGVDDYLLASTLVGASAQRLVRCLCPDCRTEVQVDGDVLRRHLAGQEQILDGHVTDGKVTLWQPAGCPACDHTGYRGRTIIHELMPVDEQLRQQVYGHRDSADIEKSLLSDGWVNMRGSGIKKALGGRTSLEEVLRMTSGSY